MSFLRLSALFMALGLAACTCGQKPVTNSLKADGESCAADEECESSLCDNLPGKEKICFKKCAAGCKTGDICTALAVNDRFACVPEVPGLCQPCALNVDCPYPGDRCLEIGGTKVCARDCSFDGQCPSSYRCADGTDTNGQYVTKQCQPTSGTCECVAASAGQTQPCSETNTFGTCTGVRTCRPPNGYEACTAPVPTSESCNGRDDDCNGMTDENLGDTTCGTGECRRTVTNCVNGAPQGCDPLPPAQEICDEKDNDCDSVIDDGFDKQTSLANCGTCGNVCARPHATPVCMGGMCRIGMCDVGWINADNIDANGCELMCTITGPEICDGTDNNCDGRIDEGFATASDPLNCGLCGRVCNVNNGNVNQYACIASTCGIMTCNSGFADCDQQYGTGCEKPVSADVNNCGACNNVCTTPNATPACASSMCAIGMCNAGYSNCDNQVATGCEVQTSSDVNACGSCTNVCPTRNNSTRTCVAGGCGFTCNPGWTNLDGLAANGCEYSCTPSGVDDPDDSATDQNCDGIDGDESRAIFVATNGNDINPGTKALPKASVQAGINAASSVQPHVYVSEGVYFESITLRSGISVFGGYSASNNWVRNSGLYSVTVRNTVTVSGRVIAASGRDITSPTRVAYFTLQAGNASGAGGSSYGLHCVNCPGLTLVRSSISAGSGANGTNGVNGTAGANGGDGSPGGSGDVDGPAGAGGNGGVSACNRAGGRGGNGGPTGSNRGQNGSPGNSGFAGGGAAGIGGNGCSAGLFSTCDASPGTNGQQGPAVSNGADGTGGLLISVASEFLVCEAGGDGTDGAHGNGGGGGGGGGGQGGAGPIDGGGNGGGGGGAGGCGGTRATGGGAGGSSTAVFLVNSTGITFQNCTFTSGSGGTGGTGGTGGGAGIRGTGRNGGTAGNGNEIGLGGNGANGTSGGRGGHGGGGMGGFSYGIYRVNSTPTITGTTTYNTGAAGAGGGAPLSPGANGQSGDIN